MKTSHYEYLKPGGRVMHIGIRGGYTRSALVVSFVTVLFAGSGFAQTLPEGWLYTEGNRIYIADGDGDRTNDAVFAGRGANIFDTRSCGAGYADRNVEEVKRRIDELVDVWGADFMRLCLESKASLDSWMVHGLSLLEDTTGYLDDIVEIVEHVGTKPNTYVLVSLWGSATLDDMGWPTDETNRELEIIVPALAAYPQVIFGICNEPQSNSNGNLDADVLERMNSAVTVIRDAEAATSYPQHVISVQGTRQWARYIDYYIDNPVTAYEGANIAYETHPYDHDFGQWFYTAQQSIPVIIGEFGPATVNGTVYMTLDECEQLMDTADALQIPYAAWSFHQRCSPDLIVDQTGSGLGADMKIEPTEWGEVFMEHLSGIGKPAISNMTVTPSSILNDVSNTVVISATVTAEDSPLSSVTVDLSSLGMGSALDMIKDGDEYTYELSLEAGSDRGTVMISVTATDEAGQSRIKKSELEIIAPATENLVIYSDEESLVTGNWTGSGKLTESTEKPFEGTGHYRFEYSLADWWQGTVWGDNFGLQLSGGSGIDFSGYDRIRFAACITGDVELTVNLGDMSDTYSETIEVEGVTGEYAVFTLPLADFADADLSAVGEIKFDVSASEEKSGTLYVDNIYLLPVGAAVRGDGGMLSHYKRTMNFAQIRGISATDDGKVVVTCSLSAPCRAKMSLYNQLGRVVGTNDLGTLPAGTHTTIFKTKAVSCGVYVVKITFNDRITRSGRLILN